MSRWRWRNTAPPDDSLSDAALIDRVAAGDEDAFAHLLTRYEHNVFNYVLRMVQDETLAADLTQETWLRVFQNARSYDRARKFSTWLFAIAYHCCIDALRLRKRLTRHAMPAFRPELDGPSQSDDPQEILIRTEALAAVSAAVHTLPEPQRAVFILRHYHRLSYQDISDIVQCSLGTVKSRLHHAVRHLQQALAAQGDANSKTADAPPGSVDLPDADGLK